MLSLVPAAASRQRCLLDEGSCAVHQAMRKAGVMANDLGEVGRRAEGNLRDMICSKASIAELGRTSAGGLPPRRGLHWRASMAHPPSRQAASQFAPGQRPRRTASLAHSTRMSAAART